MLSQVKTAVCGLLLCGLPAAGQGRLVVTPKVEKHSGATWTFSYRYPQLSVPGALMGVAGNMRDYNGRKQKGMQQALTGFKPDVSTWKILPGGDRTKSTQETTYKLLASERIVSVEFDQYLMMQGAAHPNTTVFTRNFFQGGFLGLADLFGPDSDYLTKISQLVGEDLKAQAAAKKFDLQSPDGFAPKADNFKAFGITKQGLKIFLQRGQVAAGYMGNLTCTLPWASLQAIVKPEIREAIGIALKS